MLKLGWVIPKLILKASVGTKQGGGPSCLGTPIFIAGHVNLVITQAMQVDKNECPVA